MGTTGRHRVRRASAATGRARRRAAAAIALAGVVAIAACGATRSTSIPDAGAEPTTAPRLEDAGRAAQLQAIPTVITRPDSSVPAPPDTHLAELPAATAALLRRIGADTRFTHISADSSGIEWEVEADAGHGFTDTWEWRPDVEEGDGFEVRQGTTPSTDPSFTLRGVDLAAPAHLARGIERIRPASYVNDAELAADAFDHWGVAWRLRVYSPGSSATVVAAPDGDVLAVTG